MGRKPSGQPLIHRCAKIQKNGDVYVYERIRKSMVTMKRGRFLESSLRVLMIYTAN